MNYKDSFLLNLLEPEEIKKILGPDQVYTTDKEKVVEPDIDQLMDQRPTLVSETQEAIKHFKSVKLSLDFDQHLPEPDHSCDPIVQSVL